MSDLVLWTNPSCSKSQGAEELLQGRGTIRRYLDDPPTRQELEELLSKLGTDDPRTITRTSEPLYAELGLAGKDAGQLLDALAAHPELIERPIAIRGGRAVVARPPERLLELL